MLSDWLMVMGLLSVSDAVDNADVTLLAVALPRRWSATKPSASGESAGTAGNPPVN
ncbi:hypothetical protein MHEL_25660 [Mycolicibacterium helvum]|uniref:Uncharacterized protein n=1 Tax=Mycolicibacterium helvum TaxID=1534349 RepID=A0A7I7T6A8_9MYCO|nr:hypothetical protein MHEL_25660 [Mycolicibacterium helvum]